MGDQEEMALESHKEYFWNRILSRQVQYALDLLVLSLAFMVAYILRFDVDIFDHVKQFIFQYPYVLLIQFAVLALTGVYSFIWRYTGLSEAKAFLRAALFSMLPLLALRLWLPDKYGTWKIPLSIIIFDTFLAFSGTLGMRVGRRILHEHLEKQLRVRKGADTRQPVLLIGAGHAGVLAAKEIAVRGDLALDVKGFIDDEPQKLESVIQGIKVLGTTREIPRLAKEMEIKDVVITIATAPRREIRRIVDICEQAHLKVRIIPGLYELLQGKVHVSRIRPIQIEDLLGRDPVHLEKEEVAAFLSGKRVMVTGAGGSIGSELCRQIAKFAPSKLLLLERAEFALFNIDMEIKELFPEVKSVPLVGDVTDGVRMKSLLLEYRPQVILHAAAHKHVPMMEYNPEEAIKNNVVGTSTIGELAGETGAEAFVFISTDKAVRPSSVMGASKRIAELVVQDLDRRFETRYVAVRFGNVLESAGSVIPIFRQQINRGGPVTVTHPDMVRYFMTIPEATQLVLQAGAMGQGGEIFVLDMGEPVRILDLAKDMISLSGFRPFEEIDIRFTGIRPGEKLFEELMCSGENFVKTRHPKIFIGRIEPCPAKKIRTSIEQLEKLAKAGDKKGIRNCLSAVLPEARISLIEPQQIDDDTSPVT